MKDEHTNLKGRAYMRDGATFMGDDLEITYDNHRERIRVIDHATGIDFVHYDEHGAPYTECSEQVGDVSVIVPRAYDDDLRRMALMLCEENDGVDIPEEGTVEYWVVEGEKTIYLTQDEAERNSHGRWMEHMSIDRKENPQLFDLIDFMRHYPTFIARLAGVDA